MPYERWKASVALCALVALLLQLGIGLPIGVGLDPRGMYWTQDFGQHNSVAQAAAVTPIMKLLVVAETLNGIRIA